MKMRFRKIMAAMLSTAMVVAAIPAAGILNVQAKSPQEHIDLSRQVAGEGMVLMENDGALPLAQGEKVAMFGRAMIDYVRGGGGSGATNVDYTHNILQGMQIKEEEGKVTLYQPLVDFYTKQVSEKGIKNDANITVTDDMLNAAAENADTAIVTIGRYSSEGSDRSASKGDYYLSDAETELLTRVAAKFKKTVVVLNVGAVLDTEWIKDIPGIDSVLMAWQQEVESAGSGIIIGKNDSELLIATNNHVIDGAETVSVSFVDNETYEATIKGTDSDKDLAVVAVPLSSISSDTMSKISVATIGDSSKLEVGEQVVAIGNALGYGQSVTTGIVSATNRTLDSEDSSEASYDGISLIQTDAAINPGNSGGALLNMNGEVIGINSAKLASTEVEGMGYAISMNDAYDTIEELMNETTRTKVSDDEKASLGISGTGVSDEAAEAYGIPSGVFVSQVTEGGAAEQAGITANSIITAFDGKSVSDISELKSRLEYYKAGEEVEVTLQVPDGNGYTEKNVTVTLGKADSSTSGSSLQSGSDESQDQNQGQDPYNYGGSDDNSGNYFRFSNSQKSF